MKNGWNIATLAAALLLSVAVVAQQPAAQQKPQQPAKPSGQMMSMDDMMKGCREHCQATTKSIDQLAMTIEGATQSNDPARMRAGLDQVQKPLTEMRDHMKMCMQMMDMMQMHQGMMKQKPQRD